MWSVKTLILTLCQEIIMSCETHHFDSPVGSFDCSTRMALTPSHDCVVSFPFSRNWVISMQRSRIEMMEFHMAKLPDWVNENVGQMRWCARKNTIPSSVHPVTVLTVHDINTSLWVGTKFHLIQHTTSTWHFLGLWKWIRHNHWSSPMGPSFQPILPYQHGKQQEQSHETQKFYAYRGIVMLQHLYVCSNCIC